MKKYLGLILLVISALVMTSCTAPAVEPPGDQPTGDVTQDSLDDEQIEQETKQEVGVYPGMKAPNFTLQGRNNEEISLSDYDGKITFLNFWATTCKFCIEEMPDLEAFYNAHKDEEDFALLGVNMTKTWEKKSKEDLVEWLDGEGLTFPVVFDEDGTQASQWLASSLPITYIIDQNGNSLGAIMGKTDIGTLEAILEEVRTNE